MRPIRNKLIGILLGLLLAGGSWLEVYAPSAGNDSVFSSPSPTFITMSPAESKAVPKDIPSLTPRNQPAASDTATPEESNQLPDMEIATALPATQTASCSSDVVGSGVFVWPTDNHSLTGNDFGPDHPGIDIAAGEGSPIYAADAGVIIAEGDDEGGYGNMIEIDHHNGYITLYAHLSAIGVSMCQSMEAGQWIGAAGSTGNARGAHLHFAVALDGRAINPWTVLP